MNNDDERDHAEEAEHGRLMLVDQELPGLEHAQPATAPADGRPYVIVRGRDSGVFAGELAGGGQDGVTLLHARRLWYWSGAASLSELAVRGVAKPDHCKFPVAVPRIEILDPIEVLTTTPAARACIEAVPEWTAR